MDKQCGCCGLLWLRKKGSGGEGKCSSKPIVKRISKEHLLGNSAELDDKAAHQVVRQVAKFPPTSYRPPEEEQVGEAHRVEGRLYPFKELRGSRAPLILPLLRAGVKETRHEFRSQDAEGNKMVNEYVRKCKIGTGSFGKVVLHQSKKDEKLYAIKIVNKSRLRRMKVSPSETAMMDVLREVAILKRVDHPNVVKLYEVIDDPNSDRLYMVMEHVEGKSIFEGCGSPGGIGEAAARKCFRDVVAGLSYLHNHNIIHGDIKPENCLRSVDGSVKICDFGCSRTFEGDNDELWRSPGTPVFTAPECCSGLTGSYYRGRQADVWALGCTLYCMVMGRYPFMGDTLPSIYEKIVNQPLLVPEATNPELADLLRGLLCKDARKRFSLAVAAAHPWSTRGYAQVQASCNPTVYEVQHPFPAGGAALAVGGNGSVELGSVV
ncbi:serine/threonine-protein kinase GRIK1 isoform X2 [Physcomitrium patens]|uniref:non-specific serine/threonine protein kinase n=1 Tax=Physcomitrium patens TaxID=3218 RepID=A0A2K1JY57_PHYPA|nr:serine/threonine-protein kinase GRIK1-like isoform X2 [Physcomitrium patens]PNR46466.1 hypothetical protein PHYPA_013585 [Physcomitrium patens]|eukprot:XP_024387223.1 serine/threonine-protein kinase GRIK1-like isoform X2 [Physcomitrella patens]